MDEVNPQVTFDEVSEQLAGLLKEFGPVRKSYHPEFPFWHLQNEGFWTVSSPFYLERKKPGYSPTRAALLTDGVYGELSPDLWQALKSDPALISLVRNKVISRFKSLILYPAGNKHFTHSLIKYQNLLESSSRDGVYGCTFEKYINCPHGDSENRGMEKIFD
ncbi:MAG: hypothetical protein ACFCUM_17850 [Bacteroidales bacterium]